MRLYDISRADVAAAILQAVVKETEDRGNVRLMGTDLAGRAIIVVIADDDPSFVITTFPDD